MSVEGKKKGLKMITIKMPEYMVEQLDHLVNIGVFASRSEAIRLAVSKLLSEQKRRLKPRFHGDLLIEDESPF